MKRLLGALGLLLASPGLMAQIANFCDARCEQTKANIRRLEMAREADERARHDAARDQGPSSQPRAPELPRPPMSLDERNAQGRREAESYKRMTELHRSVAADVAEAYKWRYGQGVPVDRAKAMRAYRSACGTLAFSYGCAMAAELGFEALEDQRTPDDRSPASAAFREAAAPLLELSWRGCMAQERYGCFVHRRIRKALNEAYPGPGLSAAHEAEFERYDEQRRLRHARMARPANMPTAALAPAAAQPAALAVAPAPAARRWQRLGTLATGAVFSIDTASIVRAGSMVRVWELTDVPAALRLGNGAMALSRTSHLEVDCSGRRVRRLQDHGHAEAGGGGPAVASVLTPGPWEQVLPKMAIETTLASVC